jgi:hypothetical protein
VKSLKVLLDEVRDVERGLDLSPLFSAIPIRQRFTFLFGDGCVRIIKGSLPEFAIGDPTRILELALLLSFPFLERFL